MLFTTSVCANYLPKAMLLAKSVKAAHPGSRFVVCLLEKDIHPAAADCAYFDEVLLARNIGIDAFEPFIFKHSIVEAATAVKGQLFIYLMEHNQSVNKFIYLDPDICVYSPLTEVEQALDEHAIVLTPHLCHPEHTLDAVRDNELSALQHGIFNLGFLAVSRKEEADRFIRWWASRLAMYCYDDTPRGIFTDQKWIDLAPCYFTVHILKHSGYNIAPWNLSQRKVMRIGDGFEVNGESLRFFHYSGLDSGANEMMTNKYVPDMQNAVHQLRSVYVEQLDAIGQRQLGQTPWSYDYYTSGERIDVYARVVYRELTGVSYRAPNPFEKSNDYFRHYQNYRHIFRFVRNLGRMVISRLRGR